MELYLTEIKNIVCISVEIRRLLNLTTCLICNENMH